MAWIRPSPARAGRMKMGRPVYLPFVPGLPTAVSRPDCRWTRTTMGIERPCRWSRRARTLSLAVDAGGRRTAGRGGLAGLAVEAHSHAGCHLTRTPGEAGEPAVRRDTAVTALPLRLVEWG